MGELIMVFGGTGRTVRPAAPRVVPDLEPEPAGKCSACGNDRSTRYREVRAGVDLVLCLDAHGCAVRYRGGASPESYAAGLRGELLGVAP